MRHIPNIISVFRILLIPVFIWHMARDRTVGAAAVLAVSGLSDLADGFLARRYGWISRVGKILDPMADKLTQVAVCIVLMVKLRQYWLFFALLLVKDAVMLVLGGYLVKKQVKLDGSRWFGKTVTILFYVFMTLLVFFPGLPEQVTYTALTVITVCAFLAGILYLPDFLRYRRQIGGDTTREK